MTTLVVLLGPIASGKSTVAAALADRLGAACEVLDLDDVYFADPGAGWVAARAALADLVVASTAEVVVAHGPLVVDELRPDVTVLLTTTYDVALERVTADDTRGLSRDPVFLRRTYDELVEQPHDLRIDTTSISVDEAVEAVLALLVRG